MANPARLLLIWLLWHASLRADIVALYNTGSSTSDYQDTGGAVGWLNGSRYSRAQSFTNNAGPCSITSIHIWLSAAHPSSLSGTINISLFSSSGTPGSNAVPGTPSNTKAYNLSDLGLTSTAKLVAFDTLNWALEGSASNYFFVLDARGMGSQANNYFIWQYSSSVVAGQNAADTTNFSSWSHYSSTGAAQVWAAVPEPGTWMMMVVALALGGLAARPGLARKKPAVNGFIR